MLLEQLLGKHASIAFNPDIANAFFRAGLIESWGRGIERIVEACLAVGASPPVLRAESTGLWLEFALLPAEGVTPGVTPGVTTEVARLLPLCVSPRSRQSLQQELGLRDDNHFRVFYLRSALQLGLLERTIPDKPNSRLQRYRLTDLGLDTLRRISLPTTGDADVAATTL